MHQPTIWMDTLDACHEIMRSCDNWAQRGYREKSAPVECKKMARDFYFASVGIAALFAAGSVGRGPLDGRV